jgi:hypothetical protein
MAKDKELAPQSTQSLELAPQTFITQAIDKGLSVEHLERLMALQERWQANKAKMEYVIAMKGFQSECPIIEKRKKVFEKNKSKICLCTT